MTYYDNYDEEREYAREIYWESKGLGKSSPEPVVYVRDTQCPKCKRWGSANACAIHIPKCKAQYWWQYHYPKNGRHLWITMWIRINLVNPKMRRVAPPNVSGRCQSSYSQKKGQTK